MYVKITDLPQHSRVWYWTKVGKVFRVDWVKFEGYWILKVRGASKYIDADDCRPFHKEA